ncbi:hypothetical protein [Aeromicrobium sp. UC242_57]|uniref:hypothetical protein n=1 Tax=Aeromicrobium sp. UC242_57 TaxID=3374624 RepID=UPI0037AA45FB
MAVPIVFFAGIMTSGLIKNTDSLPEHLWLIPYVATLIGVAVAFVMFAVAAVRTSVRARRRRDGIFDRLAQQDAHARGLAPDEYGVYQGRVGSITEPTSSATGLLIISLVLTVLGTLVLVLAGVGIAQGMGLVDKPDDATTLSPVEWFFTFFSMILIPWSWSYYFRERRASKVRIARGLPRDLR